MDADNDLPGGPLATRPLRFYWALDVSGSMTGSKIGQLNTAVRESLGPMRDAAAENSNASVEVRALTFSSGAKWATPGPIPLDQFGWTEVQAVGITDMGHAMRLLASELSVDKMPQRALPPVIVLISDGQPTDDFESGLQDLMAQPWGQKSVRLAIAVGQDADHEVLQRFIGHAEIKPLQANNPEQLIHYIKWASTMALKAASAPPSMAASEAGTEALSPMDTLVASAVPDDMVSGLDPTAIW